MPALLDATLDCTDCSLSWEVGHGAISCPSCAFGHVRFQKFSEACGRIDDATLTCTRCSSESWPEGYGAIKSPCCGQRGGFVHFRKKWTNPRLSSATLSCIQCSATWGQGLGGIPCPTCRTGQVNFKIDKGDATLGCTKCNASWKEGHGGITCPACRRGFVKFAKYFTGSQLEDASISCTMCRNTWYEGAGAIKSPCCASGFVRFEKKCKSRHMRDARLTCTDCDASWHEGYGAIPCPGCPNGYVRFTKIFEGGKAVSKLGKDSIRSGKAGCDFSGSTLDPAMLHYTQDSIKRSFQDGRALSTTVQELLSDPGKAFTQIPSIQVFERQGKVWTADNRRLYCFRQAKLCTIPVRWIAASAVNPRKFTSMNGGLSIRVR